MSVSALTGVLLAFGGPCCGISFRPPEPGWNIGALYDLECKLESGLPVKATYRATWVERGEGKLFSRQLVLRWEP